MATFDIGIDLGTTFVKIYIVHKGIVFDEPAVIAFNDKTQEVIAVGIEAYKMLGKAPSYITVKYPLEAGVISDYKLNELMIDEMLKRASNSMLVKPRVCICVHSVITDVERRAVVDAAVSAGARKVYLIEEPIAAALGAGVDIAQPSGIMIVDIGGGTTDVAVISLNGIVLSKSIKIGGQMLDQAISKYMLVNYKILVGEQTAENAKKAIGTCCEPDENIKLKIKGRNMISGLPEYQEVTQTEVYQAIQEPLFQIRQAIRDVLEQTPPELIGDVLNSGILLTGGGALLNGMAALVEQDTHIRTILAEEPTKNAAIGTGLAFDQLDDFFGGFINASTYEH